MVVKRRLIEYNGFVQKYAPEGYTDTRSIHVKLGRRSKHLVQLALEHILDRAQDEIIRVWMHTAMGYKVTKVTIADLLTEDGTPNEMNGWHCMPVREVVSLSSDEFEFLGCDVRWGYESAPVFIES